jgi:hypothetical protein
LLRLISAAEPLTGPGAAGRLRMMSVDSEGVLREALTLPSRERAAVAAELLASLDEPASDDADAVAAAWAEELEHRSRRARSGEDRGEPWEAVRDRSRNKLTR